MAPIYNRKKYGEFLAFNGPQNMATNYGDVLYILGLFMVSLLFFGGVNYSKWRIKDSGHIPIRLDHFGNFPQFDQLLTFHFFLYVEML